jgi:hypothetical protein
VDFERAGAAETLVSSYSTLRSFYLLLTKKLRHCKWENATENTESKQNLNKFAASRQQRV